MARLLCDHGLQFSEHFVYQRETTIYPPKDAALSRNRAGAGDPRGCRPSRWIPSRFPSWSCRQTCPSCIFLSPDTSMGPGITGWLPLGSHHYLYAYLCTQPHHRKSSKVFLSFTWHSLQIPPPWSRKGTSRGNCFTRFKRPRRHWETTDPANAALDRSFFLYRGPNGCARENR